VITPEVQKVMKEKELSISEIELLQNCSFELNAIENMSKKEIYEILDYYSSNDYVQTRTSYHTYYGTVPYFGESDNTCVFESSVPITSNDIIWYCGRAKEFAEYVFSTQYNNSSTYAGQNIRFSYFLYGEKSPGIHEGVDVCNVVDNDCTIKSAHTGTILNRGGSYGIVQIDSSSGHTVTYMHMDTITTKPIAGVGLSIGHQSDVTGGDPIGEHLHFQVMDGDNTYIAPGGDYNLEADFPYYVMVWNL